MRFGEEQHEDTCRLRPRLDAMEMMVLEMRRQQRVMRGEEEPIAQNVD